MTRSSDTVALLAQLRRHDHSSLTTLERMAQANPEELSTGVREFLSIPGAGDDPSFCIVLMELLNQALGRSGAERCIRQMWASGDEAVRDNLTSGAYDPQEMATDLVLDLFNDPSSTVQDRHHLLAGLASSMGERQCERQVLALVPRVGVYTDSARQAVLTEFLAAVEQSLAESA